MKLKILLVNPWIYDFAAFNLWARPLGLLKVAEYLSAFDVELSFIDCTDAFDAKRYGAGRYRAEIVEKPQVLRGIPRHYKRYGIGIEEFTARLRRLLPFDIVLVTSLMSYWYPGVQKAVELVREAAGDVPVVLGGAYATLCMDHAGKHSGADFIYHGNAGRALDFSLYTFGFRAKRKRGPVPYYKLGLYRDMPFAPLLTSTGCPFRCSYCASGLLHPRYSRRPHEEVAEEVKELYAMGVRDYTFYDDALLVDSGEHIKPILREIARAGIEAGMHAPNGLHARFVDGELAKLLKRSGFRTIRLSLETVDGSRQKATGGKIDNGAFETAVAHLKQQGFTKRELGAYLMYGLPGQGLAEVREGVDFLKSLGVRIHLAEFSPIKGTELWDEMVRGGAIEDGIDPLLTNNTVFSQLFSGYDPGEVKELKLDVKMYNET
ncbi:MAG TPA: B12-binding domain-containing radical SAM protein [Dissulfurispiraceae bacterium]